MSAMRIAGKLCKPKLVVKLIVLVGVVSPFVVFLLRNGDSENNQQGKLLVTGFKLFKYCLGSIQLGFAIIDVLSSTILGSGFDNIS